MVHMQVSVLIQEGYNSRQLNGTLLYQVTFKTRKSEQKAYDDILWVLTNKRQEVSKSDKKRQEVSRSVKNMFLLIISNIYY